MLLHTLLVLLLAAAGDQVLAESSSTGQTPWGKL